MTHIYFTSLQWITALSPEHDDVIKWKYFPRHRPFVRGNHRSPSQRPVMQSFDVFFHLRLNKWLRKQWRGWWFETQSCSLWHHCNDKHGRPWHTITSNITARPICFCTYFRSKFKIKMSRAIGIAVYNTSAHYCWAASLGEPFCNCGLICHWSVIHFEISINNTDNNDTTNRKVLNHLSPIKYKSRWAVQIGKNSSLATVAIGVYP